MRGCYHVGGRGRRVRRGGRGAAGYRATPARTGRHGNAQREEVAEALEGGLVSEILEPDVLLPRARELGREIAENTGSVSVALARQTMWPMLGASHPREAHRVDSRAMNDMGARADSREGVTSFLEKRAPIFPLRVTKDFLDDVGLRDEPPFDESR